MSESRTLNGPAWSSWTALLVATGFAVACVDDGVAPAPRPPPPSQPRVLGVAELTFSAIGTPDISSSLLIAPSMTALEALRAERDRLHDYDGMIAMDLTPPANANDSGNGTIQLAMDSSGEFTHEGVRYLHATFNVRNAQLDGSPYDTERTNLTFLGVSADNTVNETAVRQLRLGDGSPAPPDLALEVLPTGLAVVVDDTLTVAHADVLQVLTEGEAAAVDAPAAVTTVFPYGFIVRNATSDNTRTLPASPAPGQFDGIIDFAFQIPLQPDSAANPETLSVLMLALDDSDTRLTQSLQGHAVDARLALQARAEALGASVITLMPGGTLPGPSDLRTLCTVRTAGTANEPAAHLVNVFWEFGSFIPDPYIDDGSASFIASTTSFQAAFSADLEGVGPENFTVRGLQSGPAFLGQAYNGNGTSTISTPAGSFFAGEEVEIAVTNALACPQQPPVARYRVAAAQATGSFDPDSTYETDDAPVSVAIGDLTGNGVLDVVTANPVAFDENNISVLLGNGDGTFEAHQTFNVARSPESVAIGDLNGDGDLDVVTVNSGAANISVLLGNGDGTFQTQHTFGVGNTPIAIGIGDLTGNGILDVVTTNSGTNDISVLLGNGDGTFQPQQTFDAVTEPASVAIGDLTGDGVLDIVIAGLGMVGPSLSMLLGNGDGTFQAQQTLGVSGQLSHVAIGDLNNDGNLDLAFANFAVDVNSVTVLFGDGNGNFSDVQTFDVGSRPTSIAIGDLTGDGALDLVVTNAASADVSVLLGDGNGDFQDQQLFDVGAEPLSVVVGDLSGNGVLDVVTANTESNNISVLLGNPQTSAVRLSLSKSRTLKSPAKSSWTALLVARTRGHHERRAGVGAIRESDGSGRRRDPSRR